MTFLKKTVIAALLFSFMLLSTVPAAFADDTMQKTVSDALWGGALGGLIGAAVTLLSKKPSGHLSNIPTGAALGVLFGAAYGLATSGTVQSVGEVEGGKFTLHVPTVEHIASYGRNADKTESVERVSLMNYRF
ncbi:MAG: hypothetical protein HY894_09230 [Deltaproteobacteria bacterium]|nr:hypothetical protein [Deltaproteobacteria bacterium]